MGWYRNLTQSQRRILIALTSSVLIVVGLLAWSVWSALGDRASPSPLPTPPLQRTSVLPTPTPLPSPSPTSPSQPQPSPTYDVSQAGFVAAAVAEARQAQTRWGTPLTLVDDTGMGQALYTHYQAQPPLVSEARDTLKALRLWFWDPLRADYVSQAEHAAAFYVPELEELYLRRDWHGPLDALEIDLAYGYARALPEQTEDLSALREESTSLDRRLALAAVAEGDALVSVWLYRGAVPGTRAAGAIQDEVADAICPRWQTLDPLLTDLTCLSLELGGEFATARYLDGGIAALDDAIVRPPRSTEQVLHPERYVAGDEPRLLQPVAPDLGRDWVLTTTETLGEALMDVVLAEWSDGVLTDSAAIDWGGDLLQVWQGPEDASVAVWQTAWDRASAASGFYGALREMMPSPLVRGLIRDTTPSADLPRGRWWAGSQGAVFLYRYGDSVWLVWGTDPTAVETVAGGIAP